VKWTIYILSILIYLQFVGVIAVFHVSNDSGLVDVKVVETCDQSHEVLSCCKVKVEEPVSCCSSEIKSAIASEDDASHDCEEGNCSDDDCDCTCCQHTSPIFLAYFFDEKKVLESNDLSTSISPFFEDYISGFSKTCFQPPRLV